MFKLRVTFTFPTGFTREQKVAYAAAHTVNERFSPSSVPDDSFATAVDADAAATNAYLGTGSDGVGANWMVVPAS